MDPLMSRPLAAFAVAATLIALGLALTLYDRLTHGGLTWP